MPQHALDENGYNIPVLASPTPFLRVDDSPCCQASALSTVATPPPVNVAESGISTSRARDRPTPW